MKAQSRSISQSVKANYTYVAAVAAAHAHTQNLFIGIVSAQAKYLSLQLIDFELLFLLTHFICF